MSSSTNPNVCPRCQSCLVGAYRSQGTSGWWLWTCPVCDKPPTPPQPAPVVLWRMPNGEYVDPRRIAMPRGEAVDASHFMATEHVAYPAALDPASKVAALTEERDTALARIKEMEEARAALKEIDHE